MAVKAVQVLTVSEVFYSAQRFLLQMNRTKHQLHRKTQACWYASDALCIRNAEISISKNRRLHKLFELSSMEFHPTYLISSFFGLIMITLHWPTKYNFYYQKIIDQTFKFHFFRWTLYWKKWCKYFHKNQEKRSK